MARNIRTTNKASFKVPIVIPKSEIDRVGSQIKCTHIVSLEPLDTKHL